MDEERRKRERRPSKPDREFPSRPEVSADAVLGATDYGAGSELEDFWDFVAGDLNDDDAIPSPDPVFRSRLRERLWQILSMKRAAKIGSLH